MSNVLIDDAWSSVGPQTDGTYAIPSAAQPNNSPQNTAGYPADSSSSALDILKYGVGVITNAWQFNSMLDYKKFEATNGGLYRQGAPAPLSVQAGGMGSPLILALLALGGYLLFVKKA